MSDLQTLELIAGKIVTLRGQRVMIDADLAALYGVSTKALNQAVKRNSVRFPEDFMFQLAATEKEKESGRKRPIGFGPWNEQ